MNEENRDLIKKLLHHFHTQKLSNVIPPMGTTPWVTTDASILQVLKALETKDHVWVVNDEQGMGLKGIIEYEDATSALLHPADTTSRFRNLDDFARSLLTGARVSADMMRRDVSTTDRQGTVLDALRVMRDRDVEILGVVDSDGRLTGEISLRLLIREFLALVEALES